MNFSENNNIYILDGDRLSHLFTVNAIPGAEAFSKDFSFCPKSSFCFYYPGD
ncbi:MAG: hypothetical protein K6A42_09830 [Treponema sp.]|nr:hypothetical protein [Treponema sp.]